ncbi:MAG: NAD(+) kinase [Pseudomonadales bacterium]|nr:NAD(+) kinase [Pseudomonadales bacterium]
MTEFRTIGLVSRVSNDQIRESLLAVVPLLVNRDIQVLADEVASGMLGEAGCKRASWDEMGQECDLLIAVGGDGNILSAARAMAPHGVPILGINRGKLGFLADVSPDQIDDQLNSVLAGDYTTEEHFLLEGLVEGHDEAPSALNEVLVHSASMPKMIEMELYVDGKFVYTQNSDGLIVSSPTGSTAYALSAGGPIMHPSLDAIVLVPMFPHSLTSRPLVVPGNGEIRVVIGSETDVEAKVSFDSHLEFRIKPGDSLVIRKKRELLQLIHPPGHSFYEVCRSKLDWASRNKNR